MPLILQPTFSDKTREEIEQHLLVVRARRMAAVAQYYSGINAKTLHLMTKEQQRIAREYEMLKKELDRMAKLEVAIENRLAKLSLHQQELDIHAGNLVEIDHGFGEQKANGDARGKERAAFRSGRAPGT